MPVAPIEAIQLTSGESFVYVLAGDTVHRRKVKTGVDGGDWLEILEGLKAGEDVVVAGLEALSDGAKVRTARVEPPGPHEARTETPAPRAQ